MLPGEKERLLPHLPIIVENFAKFRRALAFDPFGHEAIDRRVARPGGAAGDRATIRAARPNQSVAVPDQSQFTRGTPLILGARFEFGYNHVGAQNPE